MANEAVESQLPIMVRRPRAVWPGLDRMDLHRKRIAGDGNCLFASLADQLYGSPDKHLEIRAAVIDHMRSYRPLFESFAIKDDIQQKRATRAATSAIRNKASDDTFEDYLSIMCKSGTYGGEPELMAFVQSYDQDVLVHLPRMQGYLESIPYSNQHRGEEVHPKPTLHLCYGGDEVTFPHYDSARRNTPNPLDVALTERPKKTQAANLPFIEHPTTSKILSPRAIRSGRPELSRDLMHDMIIKGSKEFRTTFDDTDRARSPSVSSSHHSSSSKRSFDDEGESQRSSKRADRRKSNRVRGTLDQSSLVRPRTLKLTLSTQSQPATPQSTQSTQSTQSSDYSSDQSEHGTDLDSKLCQEHEPWPVLSDDVIKNTQPAHRPMSPTGKQISVKPLPQAIMEERQRALLQT